jgi:hypothetical protein
MVKTTVLDEIKNTFTYLNIKFSVFYIFLMAINNAIVIILRLCKGKDYVHFSNENYVLLLISLL